VPRLVDRNGHPLSVGLENGTERGERFREPILPQHSVDSIPTIDIRHLPFAIWHLTLRRTPKKPGPAKQSRAFD
jgi:hypothetical protein